jgi:hypothetical protein
MRLKKRLNKTAGIGIFKLKGEKRCVLSEASYPNWMTTKR